MAPIKQGAYEFKAESLIEIRRHLGISQKKMAEHLGIPSNTLSRWENKTTVPDAKHLAGIYSFAKENSINPVFFGFRKVVRDSSKPRNNLLVMWDFRTLGVNANQAAQADTWIRAQLKQKFGKMPHELYKAFSHPSQTNATDILNDDLGWRVWEDNTGMDEELIDQARSDAGQDPHGVIFVLITGDPIFADLIDELQKEGVRVYLIALENTVPQLVEKVGQRRWIKWG